MTFFLGSLLSMYSGSKSGSTSSTGSTSSKDGIVEGTGKGDLINTAYTGDPNGDRVDANDAVLGNIGSDDDIILGRGGDDTILAGDGNDTVLGGSGDDSILGQDGNDVLFGDAGVAATGTAPRESFEWSKAPDPSGDGTAIDEDDNLKAGFVQNTGTVNVTFELKSFSPDKNAHQEYTADNQNINGIVGDSSGVNKNSAFESFANKSGETAFSLKFDTEVDNVSFNINDIDNSGAVKIIAYDAAGNKLDVDLTGGSCVELSNSGNVYLAKSKGGDEEADGSKYSVNVSIDGPVSRIEFVHTGSTSGNSGINVTDVFFDNPATLIIDDTSMGDDTIHGGEGDDLIFGDSGNAPATVRENFEWEGVTDRQIDNGFTQDTGNVTVKFSQVIDTGNHAADASTAQLNTTGVISNGDPVDDNSSLQSVTHGKGNTGQFQWEFSDPVANVSFNINDLDYDGIVKVEAYDLSGNLIKVDLTSGSGITLYDNDAAPGYDTADSKGGGGSVDSTKYTVNVSIPGPVSRIVLTHSQDGHNNSGINVTEMYYDTSIGPVTPGTEGGDDVITGDAGNDTIYGEGGDDSIDGGANDDYIEGNNGDDTIAGGSGNDTIYGDTPGAAPAIAAATLRTAVAATSSTGAGNDSIMGGAGDDVIDGGAGNDTIRGEAGNDSMRGGDDEDLFLDVNGGDTIDGGSGPLATDYDVIDLTGSLNGGSYRLENLRGDTDAGDSVDDGSRNDGQDGTIVFTDAAGKETGRLDFTNIESIVPCFTPGSLIATAKGQRRVEDLQPGDMIITRDNGLQEIAWVGQRSLTQKDFIRRPELKPVLIKAGSLGEDMPERDIMVSPNHRMLIADKGVSMYFDEPEVLAAAKHLVGKDGISHVDVPETSYIHFMFERHEVVLSDGTWTESFYPGDYTIDGLGSDQRDEILTLFPELETEMGIKNYRTARPTVKKYEAKLLFS
ncbi:Hint domain-containing protein [uncultured Sulfitobacter sp.]|uniref:Hint domain-containing protein n=1 Tax=uncultured Sulfitobacter sp. TaxID=191468 RepID=UPI0030D883A4